MKKIKKKIIINAIFVLVTSFTIGIPVSLITISMITGKEKPAQGNKLKHIAKISKTIRFMNKRQ